MFYRLYTSPNGMTVMVRSVDTDEADSRQLLEEKYPEQVIFRHIFTVFADEQVDENPQWLSPFHSSDCHEQDTNGYAIECCDRWRSNHPNWCYDHHRDNCPNCS